MTIRELAVLVLLYRACPDEALRRRVLKTLPELGELVGELSEGDRGFTQPLRDNAR